MKNSKTQNRLLKFFKDKRKKNVFKMFKESIYLLITKKEIPFYYFKYLYRKDVVNYKDYISTKEASRIHLSHLCNNLEYKTILSNKLNFSIFCQENNIPHSELVSYNLGFDFFYKDETFNVKTTKELYNFFNHIHNKSNNENIFIKPLSSFGGKGCFKINKSNLKDNINECSSYIIGNEYIHEKVIEQHREVSKIFSSAINTVRLLTFIDKNDKIHILTGYMRFGTGNSIVDNGGSGGFGVGINLETGTLNKFGDQDMKYGGNRYIAHPDSGFVFNGFKIPHFTKACELVIKATRYIPNRIIGWDIAILNDRPIVIEANENPSLFSADVHYGGLMKHPLFKDIIDEVNTY